MLSILFFAAPAVRAQAAADTNEYVLPTNAVVGGKTMAEWSAEWWKWVFSTSINQHPLLETDGMWANVGQPDSPMFFVATLFNQCSFVERTFTVPEGKYLLFPLVSAAVDNVDIITPLTVEELREIVALFLDLTSELHASIDGIPVPNLFDHRAITPVFSVFNETADNLWSLVLGHPVVGLVDPIVSEGYWVMLRPLPPGKHVINFGATLGPPFDCSVDITDTITVVRTPLSQFVDELRAKLAPLPPNRVQPLRASLDGAAAAFARGSLAAGANQMRAFQNKIRAQMASDDEGIAAELIEAAQIIIDRAAQQQINTR